MQILIKRIGFLKIRVFHKLTTKNLICMVFHSGRFRVTSWQSPLRTRIRGIDDGPTAHFTVECTIDCWKKNMYKALLFLVWDSYLQEYIFITKNKYIMFQKNGGSLVRVWSNGLQLKSIFTHASCKLTHEFRASQGYTKVMCKFTHELRAISMLSAKKFL